MKTPTSAPALKPNPGGQIAPADILGRDELIARLWEILEGRCVYINDLRRIGKTQIMVKMHAEPPVGWVTVKRDLGGCHTAEEFATLVYKDSSEALRGRKLALRTMGDWLGKLQGLEIGKVIKLPSGETAEWKEVLRRTFADLHEQMTELDMRLVFLWDEVPFLLDNIATKKKDPTTAMEVLDVMRALSQDYDRVRLLLTGSIGLHHILTALEQEDYSNSPLNRMELVQPGPLDRNHALDLARRLMPGCGAKFSDAGECAAAITDLTGGVAFYIHKLLSRLPKSQPLNATLIEEVLNKEITSDNNDWDLHHYDKRLKHYYKGRDTTARRILDTVALSAEPIDFHGIKRALSTHGPVDDEALRNLLSLLCRDHYLTRAEGNRYRFYLELIRRWWTLSRSLV